MIIHKSTILTKCLSIRKYCASWRARQNCYSDKKLPWSY